MSTLLRCLFCLALLGCGSTQLDVMTVANAAEPPAGKSQSLTLKVGQAATPTQFGFSIQLIDFKDSRCPTGTQCIWAGHAQASLQLVRPGAAVETIVIGTQAPPSMKLPFQATSGDVSFTLIALEPVPSIKATISAESIRVTVLIEKP